MNTSSLRAVTLQTVANYAQAAERAVLAYRVGGHRLIAAMQRGVDLAAQTGPERLANALRRAGGNVSGTARVRRAAKVKPVAAAVAAVQDAVAA